MVYMVPLKYYLFLIKIEPKNFIPKKEKQYVINIAIKSLKRANMITPWLNNCMIKSITLKLILNSLGINCKVTLSVFKSSQSYLYAHAFLKIPYYRNFIEKKEFNEIITIS